MQKSRKSTDVVLGLAGDCPGRPRLEQALNVLMQEPAEAVTAGRKKGIKAFQTLKLRLMGPRIPGYTCQSASGGLGASQGAHFPPHCMTLSPPLSPVFSPANGAVVVPLPLT